MRGPVARRPDHSRPHIAAQPAAAPEDAVAVADEDEAAPLALADHDPGAESEDFGYDLDISGPLSAADIDALADEGAEAERLAAEEDARAEAERLAAEEAARIEAERLAAEEAARIEAERLAAEEAARAEAERLAAEEAARAEAERLAAEDAARADEDRLAEEQAERVRRRQRRRAERAAAAEAARAAAEAAPEAAPEAAHESEPPTAALEIEDTDLPDAAIHEVGTDVPSAEPETAPQAATPEMAISETATSDTAEAEAQPEDADAAGPDAVGPDADTLSSVLAALAPESAPKTPDLSAADPADTIEATDAAVLAALAAALPATEAPEAPESAADAAPDAASDAEPPTDTPTDTPAEAGEELLFEPVEPIRPQRPLIRARVIKVRRPDATPQPVPAAVTEDQTGAEDETGADEAASLGPSGLSPEQEAELMAELAALESDLPGEADTPSARGLDDEIDSAVTELYALEAEALDPAPRITRAQTEPEDAEIVEDLEAALAADLDLGAETEQAAAAQDAPMVADAAPTEALIAAAMGTEAESAEPEIAEPEIAEDAAAEAETGDILGLAPQDAGIDAAITPTETAADPAPAEAPEEAAEAAAPALAPDVFVLRPATRADADADAENEAAPAEPKPATPEPEARAAQSAEDDLSRLMSKADEAMSGSESRRRFSAIAHLKAAVAATVADRLSRGKDADAADETQPFRDDLSQAVRPRRPVALGAGTTRRPEQIEPRPAPLILVSEQRVDRSEGAPAVAPQVVRPRRITASQVLSTEDTAEDDAAEELAPLAPAEAASFADYAEAQGALGLADLLEAAAAYTAQVEGRPHFSPPQILKKVAAVDEATTPEERLQVFGKLLRQGKIAKVKRGQYAITEASRYYARRA
ncbi:MAG: hypothetical protein IE922_12070 [Sphingomonadales bacterium]|nr:hypothetical protein [Sphingomonadales bacterium]